MVVLSIGQPNDESTHRYTDPMKFDTPPLRATGTSLHRQVFLVLRDRIVQGVYAQGDALPKEEALVEQFGVARVTVRRALADLEHEGLVQRRHGRGTFVLGDARSAPRVPTLGYVDEMKHYAQTTRVEVLTVETTAPPPWIAEALHIGTAARAVHAVRLRSVDATPVMLTDAWVPEELGRAITVRALKKRALYQILMEQDIVFGRVLQRISAEVADPSKAALLNCEVSSPLICLTRLLHDRSGKPVQHLTVYLTPERSCILMDISGDAVNTLGGGHIVHDVQTARGSASRGKTRVV